MGWGRVGRVSWIGGGFIQDFFDSAAGAGLLSGTPMLRARTNRCVVGIAAVVVCASVGAAAVQAQVVVQSRPKPQHLPRGEKHSFEREINALEEQWRQASLSGDVAAMDKLLGDDYIGINSTGLVSDKQQQLERLKTRTAMPIRMDVNDRKVKILGHTAIVTSRVTVAGTANEGTFRYTRVYSRLPNGMWKIVNFESTRILSPGAAAAARMLATPPPPGPPSAEAGTH